MNPFKRIEQLEKDLKVVYNLYWEQQRLVSQIIDHLGLEIHQVRAHTTLQKKLDKGLFNSAQFNAAQGVIGPGI